MKTTLQAFCDCLGWKGGTIQQAKERFAIASSKEMDMICSYLGSRTSEISDLELVSYFMKARLDASGLVIRAMKAGK